MKRRNLLLAAPGLVLHRRALAQARYPDTTRTLTLICPYPAGGNADQRSRQIGRYLSTALGLSVIVDNRGGAGGNIGTEAIAHARPDGYTIGMGNFAPLSVNPHLFPRLGFDPLRELRPVCLLEKGPLVLMVRPDSPIRTLADLIATARAHPGQLSYAHGGIGGSHHLAAEMFKLRAGISINSVPYRGGALATIDLLGGQVDLMFEQMYSAAPNIRSGKLRPLAITSAQRSTLFPDIRTFAEQGFPGFEVSNWQGLIAPAGTSDPVVRRLNEACNSALADAGFRQQILAIGDEPAGGTPAQFEALIRSEYERWGKLIRQAGISAD